MSGDDACGHGPRIGAKLVALKRVLLRAGVEKDSECTEIVHPGSTVVVLRTGRNSDGQLRVLCARGWLSLAASSGEPLLEPMSARSSGAAVATSTPEVPGVSRAPSAEEQTEPLDSVIRVVKDVRDATPKSVGVVTERTPKLEQVEEEQLPPPTSVAKTNGTVVAAAPVVGAVAPGKAGLPEPPTPPPGAAAPAQDVVELAEVTQLKQQLALAHQELDRLKAASSAGHVAPVDLARAAVQLTSTAYGNGSGPSLPSSSPTGAIGTPVLPRPLTTQGTWAGGLSPFARARRYQAEMMNARQGPQTLGSTAAGSSGGLRAPPVSTSPRPTPRPTTASPESGWGSSRQPMPRTQARDGNGSPRSRSTSRSGRDLDADPLVLGEARQVKIDQWIDQWCIRQGIAGHGGVVRMGLDKALIEPQDWITTLRNLSDGEMLEFLAAARDAGRTERRQRRVAADTRVYGSRRQPSPRRSQQVHVLRMHSSSPTRRGVVALESSWDERASPSAQRGVNWGDPPIRGSINEVGGMALQRPPSPSGVPRRPTSPFSRVKEEWGHSGTDNRVAGEMVVQRRSPQRGASPTNSHMEATRFATSSAPTGRLPSTPSSPKQKQNGLPVSPRKPLVWSQGLVEGARIFVNDSESPYANQYGEIAKVDVSTVKILCDEQYHGDRPRVVRMASVVLADHPGLPKQTQRPVKGGTGRGSRSARIVGARHR